jgi:hypothetical protein
MKKGGNPQYLTNKGKGRKKGSKNKATLLREDILKHFLAALQGYGAQKAFDEWIANKGSRRDAMKAAMDLIPKQTEHSGEVRLKFSCAGDEAPKPGDSQPGPDEKK